MAYKMQSPYKMIVGNTKPSKKNKMAKLDTSSLPKYKGGTAPMARGNMLKLSKAAKKMAKAFLSKKTNREKVTGMSEKYFKNVEKSFKNNPNLKKSSPGYYTIKK